MGFANNRSSRIPVRDESRLRALGALGDAVVIAEQVLLRLCEAGVMVVMVTRPLGLTQRLAADPLGATLLRAERLDDGTRTFRIVPGAPEPRVHGADLHRRVFGDE